MPGNILLGDAERSLLRCLIQDQEAKTADLLARKLDVSRRTVYYAASRVSMALAENGLPPLESRRGRGFRLTEEQRNFALAVLRQESDREAGYLLSAKERIAAVICAVASFPGKLCSDRLAEICGVSRSTFLADLKRARAVLAPLGTELEFDRKEGYRLSCGKLEQRALFVYYLADCLPIFTQTRFDYLDFERIRSNLSCLEQVEKELQVEFVENTLRIQAALIEAAEANGWGLEEQPFFPKELEKSEEYLALGRWFPRMPAAERYFFSAQLNCARIVWGRRRAFAFNYCGQDAAGIASALVSQFETISCVTFRDRGGLIQHLTAHMETSLSRYHLGIIDRNPFSKDVRRNYPEVFYLVQKSSEVLNRVYPMSEDEIAYITIYFCAYFNANGFRDGKRLRVVLVCPNSMATSVLMKHDLQEFSGLLQVTDMVPARTMPSYTKEYDFIISTVPLPGTERVLQVSPLMTAEDRQRIISQIFQYRWKENTRYNASSIYNRLKPYLAEGMEREAYQTIRGYLRESAMDKDAAAAVQKASLLDTLLPRRVTLETERLPFQDAVWKAAGPLLREQIITPTYVEAMIRCQAEYGGYSLLSPDLVLAHASPEDGVLALGISLLIAPQGIVLQSGQTARLMLLLAPVDQQRHLNIIGDIVDCFSGGEIAAKLVKAKDGEEACRIIRMEMLRDRKEM